MKAYENHYSGVGSQSFGASIEKLRTKPVNDDIHAEILLEELRPDFMNNVMGMAERNQVVTPGNSGPFSSSKLNQSLHSISMVRTLRWL